MSALELSGAAARLGSPCAHALVFLPGFMSPAGAYRDLLTPLALAGIDVLVPQLYRLGPTALLGGVAVADEAAAAADEVREFVAARPGAAVVLAGHSRGGQAAWRATALLGPAQPADGSGRRSGLPAGLVLLDPVDGEGRPPAEPVTTREVPAPVCPTLIIGAGLGGRCAPEGVNHVVFAAAAPAARHVVIPDLGHADMLGGRARSLGRRLCPGGPDPDAGRTECTELLLDFALGL